MDDVLILEARKRFHQKLIESGIWVVDANGVPSNADVGDSKKAKLGKYNTSTLIAQKMAAFVGVPQVTSEKKKGTSAGVKVEDLIAEFIDETFPKLQHLRPGHWTVLSLGNHASMKTSSFAQYEHLEYLTELAKANSKLMTVLGNDYVVAPDIVVYRDLYEDDEINAGRLYINDDICQKATLRKKYGGKPILHASVSSKWTMRSDRAQNSRTEALNLIRNRKGNLPHIMVVTNEPLPSRIASLALGTGDIDCLYHCALYELMEAAKEYSDETNRSEVYETLENLVEGKRLKDISDLPLDLSV